MKEKKAVAVPGIAAAFLCLQVSLSDTKYRALSMSATRYDVSCRQKCQIMHQLYQLFNSNYGQSLFLCLCNVIRESVWPNQKIVWLMLQFRRTDESVKGSTRGCFIQP